MEAIDSWETGDIRKLQVTVRTQHRMQRRGIIFVEQITRLTEREFSDKFGERSLSDVKEGLEHVGRSFRKERNATTDV